MRFELKVLSAQGDIGIITLDANDAGSAQQEALRQGCVVLSVKAGTLLKNPLHLKRSDFQIMLFSQELLSLIEAGLGLMEAMEALREKEYRDHARRVLDQIVAALQEGLPLSVALKNTGGTFPPLYIALVHSSEKTGNLAEVLSRYIEYQSQVEAARKKIISASIYPALLVVVGGLVILFLLLFVVPRFSAIYEGSDASLPWLSRMMLEWGRLLHAHALEAASIAIVLIACTGYGLSRTAVRNQIRLKLCGIPAIGERLRVFQLARFYRTLGMLLRGGIPIVTAMEMVAGLLPQYLQSSLDQAIRNIRSGLAFSTAIEMHGLSTPVAVRMLRVGERSGSMGDMMERIGRFHEDEMARWLDWFSRLFEPILMTGIGIVVGVIVILMYMPIFELAGSIQ